MKRKYNIAYDKYDIVKGSMYTNKIIMGNIFQNPMFRNIMFTFIIP